jgi:DNA repair protein RecO
MLREKDLAAVLFTREHGKILAIGKGVRSITSKRSAHIQTGNLISVQLGLSQNSGWYLGATTLRSGFAKLKQDQTRLHAYYICLFLIDRLLPDGVPEETIFLKLIATTRYITFADPKATIYTFAGELLQILGYGTHVITNVQDLKGYVEPLIQESLPNVNM